MRWSCNEVPRQGLRVVYIGTRQSFRKELATSRTEEEGERRPGFHGRKETTTGRSSARRIIIKEKEEEAQTNERSRELDPRL